MKKSINLIIFLFLFTASFSQTKEIEIRAKKNEDRSVDFYYTKTNPGSTFIVLRFKNLQNTSGKKTVFKTLKGRSGTVLKLTPINDKQGIGYSYSYTYWKGSNKAKPNTKFVYRLPFKTNKVVSVEDLDFLNKKFGGKPPKNWKSMKFSLQPNDTIYAIRKGVVVEVIDKYSPDNSKEFGYASKSNSILIEHSDGTLAKYQVLQKNSIMVKLGDMVYPDTPLALAGTYDKLENTQLRLGVYYLDKDADFTSSRKVTMATGGNYYAYVNPVFLTKNGEITLQSNESYEAILTNELVEEEMTKREKKKRKKK